MLLKCRKNIHIQHICVDNVCIEAMSITMTKRTLDKCENNLQNLNKVVNE